MATGRVDVFRRGSLGLSNGDYGSRFSSDVEGVFDDELPRTKKRKISPGICDLEGKHKGSESGLVVDDSDVESVHPQRETNDVGDDELEEGEVEDEGIQARDVLMSRWSSESPDDACGSGDVWERGKHRGDCSDESLVIDKKRVTPESGELRRKDSEERKYVCSGRSYSESSSDFDETVERSGSVTRMDMDSDDEGGFNRAEEPISTMGRSINMLQSCRNAFEFEKLNKINEGTYGVVYRARDKKTGKIVALKKVKMAAEREGFPLTALREINILLSFDHPSVVGVKEVVMDDHDNVYMVMEHMEHDLKGLMEVMKHPFSTSEVKCLMLQLLGGVKYLHDNWVLHRDLKTSNILFNNSGELKICDFGMSRQYGTPLKPYTPLVVTLWYRAPEVLLGTKQYSAAIDMWSVGCIMAELLTREPLFKGKAELDQLDKIFRLLGTPNETIWPGLSKLSGAKPTVNQRYNLLRKKFPAASFTGSAVLSDSGFDLLSRLLTYDPEKRITAEDALNHPWFHEIPHPKSKDFMPTFPARHAKRDP